ncbi:hypothetical protein Tco_0373770 [Tanacetum coccineum]
MHPTVAQTKKTDAPYGCKTKPDAPLGGGRGGQWCGGGGGFGGDGDEVLKMVWAVVVSWVAATVAVSGWWWRTRRVEARELVDRVDREMRNNFWFRPENSPEKFSGGGVVAVARIRRWLSEVEGEGERDVFMD